MDYEEELIQAGIRYTRNHVRVLGVLRAHEGCGFRNEDLYLALLEMGTPVPVSSIYRVVAALVEAGLARYAVPAGPQQRGVCEAVPLRDVALN